MCKRDVAWQIRRLASIFVKQVVKVRLLEHTTSQRIALKEIVVAFELSHQTTATAPWVHRVSCIGQLVTTSLQSGRFDPTFSLAMFEVPVDIACDRAIEDAIPYAGHGCSYLRHPKVFQEHDYIYME